jgi:Escherichia/Staphylococcus phage prohead protease
MNIEKRSIHNRVEVRTNLDGVAGKWLVGLAARYGSLSNDLGGFKERIAPGAFASVVGDDCRCLLNHDPNVVLGRTKSGTLRLADTAHGLSYACLLPDTQAARDLHTSVARGDIDQNSFSFGVADEKWDEATDENGNRFVRRTIRAFSRLFDVSPVTYPAYEDTHVDARALVPEVVLVEARSFAVRAGIVAVPTTPVYRPYVRMTDEEIADAVQIEKGLRGRAVGMSETAVERFIRKQKESANGN